MESDVKERRSVASLLPQLGVAVLMLTLVAAACEAAPAAAPAAEPARWRPYDVIVELHDLPKSYSCDELYYKFWEMLWALGAGSNMKVLTYDCEHRLERTAQGAPARSPRVQLQFTLPEALPGGDARWADLKAVRRTIRLEPGHPHALDSSDCALLEQIKDTLLRALPVEVVGSRLDCAAPARSAYFSVSIRTLTPEARGTVRAAAVGNGATPGV